MEGTQKVGRQKVNQKVAGYRSPSHQSKGPTPSPNTGGEGRVEEGRQNGLAVGGGQNRQQAGREEAWQSLLPGEGSQPPTGNVKEYQIIVLHL